ncbi:MAG: hypothetical protein U0324_21530 [Polyangiales bacterium]
MRPTHLALALASLAACASSQTPAPAAPHADPVPAAPTATAPEAAPGPEAVTPRPGAGTFGPGVWEPDFRHAGDTRRYRSYLFFEDGRFELRVAGYDHLPTVACNLRDAVASGGTWRREGDDVVLRTAWEEHVHGGRRAESPVRGCTDEGGSFARTELRTPREERVAVGVCAAGFLYPEAPCVTLGGEPWYRTSPDGAEPRAAWYAWCDALPEPQRPGVCRERR